MGSSLKRPTGRLMACLTLGIVFGSARPAVAQSVQVLALPAADINAPRESAALFSTDLFAPANGGRLAWAFRDSAADYRDPQVGVSIGRTIPLFEGKVRGCAWQVGGEGVVFARFRLDTHSKDNVSDDWWLAAPAAVRCGRFTTRMRVRHHSAHLGDDLMDSLHPGSYDWSHEFVDGLIRLTLIRGIDVYAGGGQTFHSPIRGEHREWTYGAESRFPVGPFGRLVAGAEHDGADRQGARGRFSGVLGLESAYPRLAPLRVLVRRISGDSQLGQFGGDAEHFWAVEIGFVP